MESHIYISHSTSILAGTLLGHLRCSTSSLTGWTFSSQQEFDEVKFVKICQPKSDIQYFIELLAVASCITAPKTKLTTELLLVAITDQNNNLRKIDQVTYQTSRQCQITSEESKPNARALTDP